MRFRKGGFSTYLTGIPWSGEDFMTPICGGARRRAGARSRQIGMPPALSRGRSMRLCVSLLLLAELPRFEAEHAQTVRRNIIESFRNKHGDKSLKGLSRAHIKAIIGAKARHARGGQQFAQSAAGCCSTMPSTWR